MASVAENSANHLHVNPAVRSVFARLLNTYARPFVGLISIAMLLSGLAAGGTYLRAYLIKPILDDVLVPAGGLMTGADWLPIPALPDFEHTPANPASPSTESSAAGAQPGAGLSASDEKQRAALEVHVRDSLFEVAIFGLIVILLMPTAQFARNYVTEYVLGRVYVDMQRDLCGRLLALPMRFHNDARRGDLLSRTLTDVRAAHGAVGLLFDDFIEAIVMTLVGAAVLVVISWQLATIFLFLGPALFGVIALFSRRISRSARRRQETFADVTQRLIEILDGIKVIKAFRAEAAEHRAFERETHKLFRRSMKVVKNRILARSLTEALNNTIAIGTILLGAGLVLGDRWGLTMGDLAAFAAVLATTYRPVKSLAGGWVRLADAQPAAARMFEVIDTPAEITDAPDAVTIDKVRRSVAFKHVVFSYGRDPVLRDVSFDLRAGEVIAIVGPTGAGKTTLVDLLLRFYDPSSGAIEIDGVDIRHVRRDSLYEHLAVVTQDPFLFDTSILENIRFGRPAASDEEVMVAARAARVDEFAAEFPEGYGTEVGSVGVRLSGGQRQRITIARAILKDPAILLLDEATSSLDSKSERFVQQAINALVSGRMVFCIAHRLSTIQNADKIIVLEGGVITQTGTHRELIERGGLYKELIELQTDPESVANAK
ncbi:MAG: ABC transporter ATP-binding protein [Myxococcota bacterium]